MGGGECVLVAFNMAVFPRIANVSPINLGTQSGSICELFYSHILFCLV